MADFKQMAMDAYNQRNYHNVNDHSNIYIAFLCALFTQLRLNLVLKSWFFFNKTEISDVIFKKHIPQI